MAEAIPYETTEGATEAAVTDVVVNTPKGARRYAIRKATAGDRLRMQRECNVDGILDLVAANILACHLLVVQPELTLEQAGDLPQVVWEQLVGHIRDHNGRTVDEIATPDAEEGAAEAAQFPDAGSDAGSGDPGVPDLGAGGVEQSPES